MKNEFLSINQFINSFYKYLYIFAIALIQYKNEVINYLETNLYMVGIYTCINIFKLYQLINFEKINIFLYNYLYIAASMYDLYM